MSIDAGRLKRQAAERALEHVQNGMRLGLGTGSTARYVIEGLAQRLRDGRLRNIVAVPTSDATTALARTLGVPLSSLDATPELDLAIDGADEVDPQLRLIKGLGGALLREKIVASAAASFVVVVDSSKLVTNLGERAPLPVEVVAFGLHPVERKLRALGCEPMLRRNADNTPFQTDEQNMILDCFFHAISEPAVLNTAIHALPGVVEHGMFLDTATMAVVAGPEGVFEMRKQASNTTRL